MMKHDEIVNQRLLEKDVVLGKALVDMYAKCGAHECTKSFLSGISSHGSTHCKICPMICPIGEEALGLRVSLQMQSPMLASLCVWHNAR